MRKTLVEQQTERLKSEYELFHKKLAEICAQYIIKENAKDVKEKPNYKAGVLFSSLSSGAKEEAKKLMAITCRLVEGDFEKSVRSLGQYYSNLKGVVTRLSKESENSKGTYKFLMQVVEALLSFGEFASQFSGDCLRDMATLEAAQSGTHKNAEKLAEKNEALEMSLSQTNTTIVNLNQSILELREQVNRSQVHSRVNEATGRASRSTLNVSIFGNAASRAARPVKEDLLKNEEARKKELTKIKALLNPLRFKAFQMLHEFSNENLAKHGDMQEIARNNQTELLVSDFSRDATLARDVMKDILKDCKCQKPFTEFVKMIQPKNELLYGLFTKLHQMATDKENADNYDKTSPFVKSKVDEAKEYDVSILLHQLFKSTIHGYFEPDQALSDDFATQAKKLKVPEGQQASKNVVKM